jgi:hypothetical protein
MSAVDNAVIAGRDVSYVPGHFEPAQARRESAAESITSAIVRCAYLETLKPSPAQKDGMNYSLGYLRGWDCISVDRPLFAFAGIWTEFKADRVQSRSRSPALTTSMAS